MTHHHTQFGMTLVEAMLVIGVFTLISISLFTSIQSLYQNNSYTFAQADEVNHARRGIYALSQDIREMTYGEDGTFPMVIKDDNRIGFYSDIDKDDSAEYVEYEIATTTLYKHVFNPTGNPPVYDLASPDESFILSEYVQNVSQGTSTFYYYDTNNTLLSSSSLLTDVRYVKAQLIINIDPFRSPGEFMLRSSIAPRNLKDNL